MPWSEIGTLGMPSDSNAHAAPLAGLPDTASPSVLSWPLCGINSVRISTFLPHGDRRSLGFLVSPGGSLLMPAIPIASA